jgi:protein-disulfide isomerase
MLDGRALGPREAPVVVELWEDFQCPACSRFTRTVEPSVLERFVPAGNVRVVFRDFAFLGKESIDAAVAARCAGEQGAFWPYHDWLYANQSGENAGWFSQTRLAAIAARLQLDPTAFDDCVVRSDVRGDVASETAAGRALGVGSTPTVMVNGVPFNGSSYDDLLTTIQSALDSASRTP